MNREKIQKVIEPMSRFFEQNRFAGLIIGFVAFLFILPFSFSSVYDFFELKLYDLRFKLKPSVAQWDKLYFLDIDEYSTVALGQFPWTRDIYAAGLDVLKELGAEQVSFDIMFPDQSPLRVNDESYNMLQEKVLAGKKLSSDELASVVKNNDQLFSESTGNSGAVLLSYTFSGDPLTDEQVARQGTKEFQAAVKRFESISSIPVPSDREKEFNDLADNDMKVIVYPIPGLMATGRMFGFVNRYTDIDGTIRRVRLIQVFNRRVYFNLSMAMLIDACNVRKENIVINPGKNIILKDAFNPLYTKKQDIVIPIDGQGMIFVNWAGPGSREESFHILPFYALLEYNDFVEWVYEFFDTISGPAGIMKRAQINTRINEIREQIPFATEEKKIALMNELKKLESEMRQEKMKCFQVLKDEKEKIEKEYAASPGVQLKADLDNAVESIKRVELVLRAEEVRDKILIIGLTATGTHDIASIPLHNEYAGVGTYHNVVNTIINGSYISKMGRFGAALMMLMIALLSGFITGSLAGRRSLVAAISSFLLLNAVVVFLFSFGNIWIDQLGTNLALVLPSVCIISIKLVSEESQKKFIKSAFSRYIAPDVIDQIMEHPEALELGGENRRITIFFSDVAGFSTISEKLSPPELVALLNEYLSEMTDIIISHGGTIDKYEGDAIMAFYGAPHPYTDHEIRACLAAIDMKRRLREMQEQWRNIGQHELFVRMGMNTGLAVVGNMGSRMRMDYTAMGDSVNLASRLEGANKHYGTTAIISENTYRNANDIVDVRRLDTIRVVGKTEPILIYELLGKKGSLPQKVYDMIEKYNEGLRMFDEHQWKKAMRHFHEALAILHDDGPSQTYIRRCEEFIKKPPSKKWDGVYTFKTK